MKLVRFGESGQEKPGIIDSLGNIRDLSRHCDDFSPKTLGDDGLLKQLTTLVPEALPAVDATVRIGPPVGTPGKIVCIGFNSSLHTEQLGVSPFAPKEMLMFLKANSSLCGPFDPVVYTRMMRKLDWEAELAIVIGKQGKYITEADARDHILGYTCMNDLSERFLQFEVGDSQFTKGKCFDNAAPLGPYIVTKDEVTNPNQLEVNLWVNHKLRQAFNTKDYIHNDIEVVSYVSRYFTLNPGDIISMGSAPGNAQYWGDDSFLKPGDLISFSISEIGTQQQSVIMEI